VSRKSPPGDPGDRFRRPLERLNRRQRAAVVTVELIGAITLVQHDLALKAPRQVEAFDERVSWIAIAVPATLAGVLVASARVVVRPKVIDAAAVTRIAVTVTRIEAAEHTPSTQADHEDIRHGRRCGVGPAHARVTVAAEEVVGRFGWVVLGSPSCALRATTSGNSTPVDVEGRR
jgi:hypothetical protein